MLSRSTLRSSRRALTCVQCAQRRGFAAPTSGSFAYEVSDTAGTKVVSRNLTGPTSTLALVSKAGTRYQWLPGLAEGLEKFAFRNTQKRFALRIVRETELLGSEFFSNRTREAIVYGASFMREDLPYFVELLAEIASETKYQHHVFHELIQPAIAEVHNKFLADPAAIALNSAHALAFHRGLGNPLYPSSHLSSSAGLVAEEIEAYAAAAYSKANFALVGSGVEQAELTKWVGEFFKDVRSTPPSGLPALESPASKYFGGEERIAHAGGNSLVLAFPGTSLENGTAYKPEIEVLAALLGGESNVKWSAGNSLLAKAAAAHPGTSIKTTTAKYSDSGLLTVTINGPSKAVAAAAKDVAKTLKEVLGGQISKDDVKKAVAQAKFKIADSASAVSSTVDLIGLNVVTNGKVPSSEEALKGISGVTEQKIKEAGKALLKSKVTVSAVGQLQDLPYAEELGLDV